MNVNLATMTGSNLHYCNKFDVVHIILNFFHAIGKNQFDMQNYKSHSFSRT